MSPAAVARARCIRERSDRERKKSDFPSRALFSRLHKLNVPSHVIAECDTVEMAEKAMKRFAEGATTPQRRYLLHVGYDPKVSYARVGLFFFFYLIRVNELNACGGMISY